MSSRIFVERLMSRNTSSIWVSTLRLAAATLAGLNLNVTAFGFLLLISLVWNIEGEWLD